jgi:hypothetical protein
MNESSQVPGAVVDPGLASLVLLLRYHGISA